MFKEIFIKLCSARGESPSSVCKKIGISAAAFSQWDRNTIPRKVTQQRAADYFGVSVDYLLGKETASSLPHAHVSAHQEENTPLSTCVIRMPVYEKFNRRTPIEASGVHSNASIPQMPTPQFSSSSISATIPFSLIGDEQEYEEYRANSGEEHMYTAIRLHDDSMAPRMMPGDVVIVKLQKAINDGDVAVLCPDDVAICRKIKKTPEGVLLLATNHAFEPIFCSDADLSSGKVCVIGVVAELRAKFSTV